MSQMTTEEVLSLFHFRSATRHYDAEKKISQEDFQCILESARLSPSSVGSEPWKFVVLQNKALRQAIKPVSWGLATQIDHASHLVILLAKKNARYDSDFFKEALLKRQLSDEQIAKAVAVYQKFQEHDMRILESERTLFDWASKQTYIALANMMTAAALLGIDSCPIEGFDYAEVSRILAEAQVFDPQEYGISVMVTFGYRAKEPRPKSRKPFNELVSWVE